MTKSNDLLPSFSIRFNARPPPHPVTAYLARGPTELPVSYLTTLFIVTPEQLVGTSAEANPPLGRAGDSSQPLP